MKSVRIKADQIKEELAKIAMDANYSCSETDYGCSCYFTFYKSSDSIEKLKVRISDHAVQNTFRMEDEYHVRESQTAEQVAVVVERYMFPERFNFIESTNRITHIINGKKGYYERK